MVTYNIRVLRITGQLSQSMSQNERDFKAQLVIKNCLDHVLAVTQDGEMYS